MSGGELGKSKKRRRVNLAGFEVFASFILSSYTVKDSLNKTVTMTMNEIY